MIDEFCPSEITIRAGRDYWYGRKIQILIAGKEYGGRWSDGWQAELRWIKIPEGGESSIACALETDQAQTLMDGLYEAGIRPTEGSGSAGSLAATQKHLDDMRKIAFDFIRDRLP